VAPRLALACLLALACAGCGGSSAPPRPAVRVSLDAPGDGAAVRADRVVVRGTVSPAGATVLVRGQAVPVDGGGAWSATIGLEAGTNVIDVLASAKGARAAMTALRVRRLVTVRVPDVSGAGGADATDRLAGLGLQAHVVDTGGFLDGLLPGKPVVCETQPAAGEVVDAGTTVQVLVSKTC